ncbi:MAG: transcription elongation factor GreA [Candidatus Nomurabacteria bacterium]|jgi:transcription elongation factor GreA|nr:transcription elongation factor GreA [Candidatus Nomurabacteria bacterium]
MSKKLFHLTKQGKRNLEAELDELVNTRPAIAQRIATAREFGDLSENAEYSAARSEQSQTEARIAEIQNILENSDLIEEKIDGKIGLGDAVKLRANDKDYEFTVVGAVEADPSSGKISNKSPLGEQLIGKTVGEHAIVTTPKGELNYEIIEVRG